MNVPEKLELPLVVKDTDGNEHEVERLVYRLERNGKIRWAKLFGTPERAAQTLFEMWPCTVYAHLKCGKCVLNGACANRDSFDALLEWLTGDA